VISGGTDFSLDSPHEALENSGGTNRNSLLNF